METGQEAKIRSKKNARFLQQRDIGVLIFGRDYSTV